jgi:hypothetical protein
MFPMPTNFPTQNNHRVALFFPEQSRDDFDRLEELTANGLRAARNALRMLQELKPQEDRVLNANIAELRETLEQRRLLNDQFRAIAASLLRRLGLQDPDEGTTEPLDQIMRDLQEALSLSHRVSDLFAAERDVGWHRDRLRSVGRGPGATGPVTVDRRTQGRKITREVIDV